MSNYRPKLSDKDKQALANLRSNVAEMQRCLGLGTLMDQIDVALRQRDEAIRLLRETRDKHDVDAWRRADAFLARFERERAEDDA